MTKCIRCEHVFTQEHPQQSICRVCVAPRCAVCRSFLTIKQARGSVVAASSNIPLYCGPQCRQRARAGDRYMILNRDSYQCRQCGHEADPTITASVATLRLYSWGSTPSTTNTVTVCKRCHRTGKLPEPDQIPLLWVAWVENRNRFFAIPDRPLKGMSRSDTRQAARRSRRKLPKKVRN